MRVKVDLTDALTPALAKLGQGFGDTGGLMLDIAEEFKGMTREAMIPGSVRPVNWKPLTKDYAKWKYKKTGVGVVNLVLLGRLYDSIQSSLNSPTEAEVSSNVPYAGVHQEGGGNNIPARPYFPILGNRLTPYAEARIYSIIDSWLTRKLQS